MSKAEANGDRAAPEWQRAEAVWAVGLLAIAVVLVGGALVRTGSAALADAPGTALFFFLFGLFSIAIGYRLPNIGYYSFDRVAQVASILVLGPVDAAWINGLASLIYPWHRLLGGVPWRNVLFASLGNAGLMASIILVSGLGYRALDGQIPLMTIGGWTPLLLIGLVLAMQALNDLGMLGFLVLGKRNLAGFFQPFSVALELGSGVTAVLVALVFNSMETSVFILLLCVLCVGMLALRQFARIRQKLEEVVADRTRSLEEKTRQLEEQAIRDNLTGLFNRRYADDFIARQLDLTQRNGMIWAVALADIDRFKQINDQNSHAMGDAVLRRVAELLTARCRKSDMIARYGGEEFLICFPETSARQAHVTCEALRIAIAQYDWASIGLNMTVTISFGIAESRDGLSAGQLVDQADVRLYEAKHGGRNLVVA